MSKFGDFFFFFWDGHFRLAIETFKIHFIFNFVIYVFFRFLAIFCQLSFKRLQKTQMGEENCHTANEKAQTRSAICFSFFWEGGGGLFPIPFLKGIW